MDLLLNKHITELKEVHRELTTRFLVQKDDFVAMTQMFVEAREEELKQLFDDYEIISEDQYAFQRFRSAMGEASYALRKEPYFVRFRIIKEAVGIIENSKWTVKYHKKGDDDVELQYIAQGQQGGQVDHLQIEQDSEGNQNEQQNQQKNDEQQVETYVQKQIENKDENQLAQAAGSKNLESQQSNKKKKWVPKQDNDEQTTIFDLMIKGGKSKSICLAAISFGQCRLITHSPRKTTTREKIFRIDGQHGTKIDLFIIQTDQINNSEIEIPSRGLFNAIAHAFTKDNRIPLKKIWGNMQRRSLWIIGPDDRRNIPVNLIDIWMIMRALIWMEELDMNQRLIYLKEASQLYMETRPLNYKEDVQLWSKDMRENFPFYFATMMVWYTLYGDKSDIMLNRLDLLKSIKFQYPQAVLAKKDKFTHLEWLSFKRFRDRILFYQNIINYRFGNIDYELNVILSQAYQNKYELLSTIAELSHKFFFDKLDLIIASISNDDQNVNPINLFTLFAKFLEQRYGNAYNQWRSQTILKCFGKIAEIINQYIIKGISIDVKKLQNYSQAINNNPQRVEKILCGNQKQQIQYFSPENLIKLYRMFKKQLSKDRHVESFFSRVKAPICKNLQSAIYARHFQILEILLSQERVEKEEYELVEKFSNKKPNGLNAQTIKKFYLLFDQSIHDELLLKVIIGYYKNNDYHLFLSNFGNLQIFNIFKNMSPQRMRKAFTQLANLIKISHTSLDFNNPTSLPRLIKQSLLIRNLDCKKMLINKIVLQVIAQKKDKDKDRNQLYTLMADKIVEEGMLDQTEKLEYLSILHTTNLFKHGLTAQEVYRAFMEFPERLRIYQEAYQSKFNQIFQSVVEQIRQFMLMESDLERLDRNKGRINIIKIDDCIFSQVLDETFNKIKKFKRNNENLIYVLEQYPSLANEVKDIRQIKQGIKKQQVNNVMVKVQQGKYSELFQIAEVLVAIRQSPYWNEKEQIKSIQDLLKIEGEARDRFMQKIQQFEEGDISISIFHQNFIKCKGIEQILSNVELKPGTKQAIMSLIHIFNDETLKKLQYYIVAYLYVSKIILGRDKEEFAETFIARMNTLMKEPEKYSAKAQQRQLERQCNVIRSLYCCEAKAENKDILQFICQMGGNETYRLFSSTERCQELYEMFTKQKISNKQIDELVEYVQDLQESQLTSENIAQLKRVIEYYQFFEEYTDTNRLIPALRQLMEKHKTPLYECLESCHALIDYFKKMIWKAKNRDLSFKIELEEMLTSSLLQIRFENKKMVLNIALKKGGSTNKLQSGKQAISWKQLQVYKQKSMLIINDIKRTHQASANQSIVHNLQVLRQFQQVFLKIERIYDYCKKLYALGYDPSNIEIKVKIKRESLDEFDKILQEYEQRCLQWTKFIKQTYASNYFLTHFIGPEINIFKQNFTSDKFLPIYERVFNLTKEKYSRLVKYDPQYKELLQHANTHASPQIILRSIAQILDNCVSLATEDSRENKIHAIICQSKYFYSCLQGQTYACITQVLMCQETTTLQQLQCFFYRAFINCGKQHFIVASHNLNEEIKSAFIDLLTALKASKEVQLKRARICFVNDKTNDKIIGFILSKKFNAEKKELTQKRCEQLTKSMIEHSLNAHTMVFESAKAGLGKTYRIQRLAKSSAHPNLIYFPICGRIHLESLAARLKEVIAENENTAFSLLVQIGYVQSKHQLEVFLSQLVLFRGFYYQEYIFLPKETPIYIEIENVYSVSKERQGYYIINILKDEKFYTFIKNFNQEEIALDQQSLEDKFTLNYLSLYHSKQILKRQLKFMRSPREGEKLQVLQYPSQEQCLMLLRQYFVKWFKTKKGQPTFLIYRTYMNMLFNLFRAFGDSPYFSLQLMEQELEQYKFLRLNEIRYEFLKICIENTLEFLQESITTNSFGHAQREAMRFFQDKIKSYNLLIVPTCDFSTYEFIYFEQKSVPYVIKSLLIRENYHLNQKSRRIRKEEDVEQIFKDTALSSYKDEELILIIFEKLSNITGNPNFSPYKEDPISKKTIPTTLKDIQDRIGQLKRYKITLDNFFKMCLIILRSLCNAPIIIMGESGVGKTALIRFLIEVVYRQTLIVKNVHAGIHQCQIRNWVRDIQEKSKEVKSPEKLWVFFDEFNTTEDLSYFKEMVIDRRFMGKPLPKNIIFLAACNPYRQRKTNNVHCGLIRAQKPQEKDTSTNNLAFKVKPPCLSMIQLMWDYQQLKHVQMRDYVSSMIGEVEFRGRRQWSKLVDSIVMAHQYFKQKKEVSSVSLRDVCRFKELYLWFLVYMPKEALLQKKSNKRKDKKKEMSQQPCLDTYKMDPNERAVILSFCFCYSLRIQNRALRRQFLVMYDMSLGFTSQNYMMRVLDQEQKEYIKRLTPSGEKIAFNAALMENLFAAMVCLNNRIPFLIIGNPGSSKSLSIRIVDSNLKGSKSPSEFCQQFEAINMLYFQGSESSTSEGVESIFDKAQDKMKKEIEFNRKRGIEKADFFNCILFDQIGLAEKSIHNPLKVLHSKLQTDKKDVGFIGISNYQLDSAKMSRFLILAHSNPDEEELKDTAVKIYESYAQGEEAYKQKFRQLGMYYSRFLQQWNKNKENITNFFGLRDFYSFIKYICEEVCKKNHVLENDYMRLVATSVKANFDGQHGSVALFFKVMRIENEHLQAINPIDLVKTNLAKPEARCLMLIIRSDALIPIINESIVINGESREVVCIYGSTFADDKQSEEYNLETTSKIITHLSRGTILTFKQINNSIQTSLYDLFNKSFVKRTTYKTCRIAVGANSNPKCIVHQKSNFIIYVEADQVDKLDLPFINRFQKHELNTRSVINEEGIELLRIVSQWVEKLLSARPVGTTLKDQNFILNCSQQALVTLILKHKDSTNKLNDIKVSLLQNRTTDFQILMKNHPEIYEGDKIQEYCSQIIPWNTNKDDLIIYTYDRFPDPQEMQMDSIYSLRIQQIKNEKSFKKRLEEGLKQNRYAKVHILLNYQTEFDHLNYILFTARQMKNFLSSGTQIVVIVQIYRSFFMKQKKNEQSINVSYLHNYKQYFLEELSFNSRIQELLQVNNLWELFRRLNLEEKLEHLQFSTLKSIKLTKQQSQSPEIIKEVFHAVSQLTNNEHYRRNLLEVIYNKLSKREADFNVLHINKENAFYSANIQQAIEQYISVEVRKIIFELECSIISEGVVFTGKNILLLKSPDHIKYLYMFFGRDMEELLQKLYQRKFQEVVNTFKMQSIESSQNKIVNFNIVRQVKVPIFQSLIPQSYKDFSQIFRMKDKQGDNVQKIMSKISVPEQPNEDHIQNIRNEIRKAQNYLRQCRYKKLTSIYPDQKSVYLIETAYFYDLFMFNIKRLNLQINPSDQCHLFDFFMSILQNCSLERKIIVLLCNTNLMTYLFSLLTVLFEEFEGLKLFIQSQQLNQENPLLYFTRLTHFIMEKSFEIIDLDVNWKKRYQNSQRYVEYFRKIYQKLRSITINIHNFSIPARIQTINSLIQLQINLSKKSQQYSHSKFIQDLFRSQIEGSLFSMIYLFVSQQLELATSPSCRDLIINYLSLNLLTDWLDSIQESGEELANCLQSFKELCNKYELFANNSTFYFDTIFSQLNELPLLELYNSIREADRDQRFNIKNQWIDFKDNFSVALGDYFKTLISGSIVEGEEQIKFLRYTQHLFKDFMRRKSLGAGLQSIFCIQFLKIYGQRYIQVLASGQQVGFTNSLEPQLQANTTAASHMRVYMLKLIYNQEKSFQAVAEKYLKVEKCKWMRQMQPYVNENKVSHFLPPALSYKEGVEIHAVNYGTMLEQFQKSRFRDIQLFHKLLEQAYFEDYQAEQCYQLLTFFLTKLYSPNFCLSDVRQILKREMHSRGDVKQQRNALIYRLLSGYLQGRITPEIFYTNDHQFSRQVYILNYLNVFISLRKSATPFTEIFFNQRGQIIKEYSDWLSARFLLGEIRHPVIARLEFINRQHKRGRHASSYTICSSTCDYITPVGGNFYGGSQGCPNPTSQARCPFCNGVLGARIEGVLLQAAEGARLVKWERIMDEMPRLRAIQRVNLIYKEQKLTLSLRGYHSGIGQRQIREKIQLKKHLEESACDNLEQYNSIITQKILTFVKHLIWYFSTSFQAIDNKECEKIWGKGSNHIVQQFQKNYEYCLEEIRREVKTEDNQEPFAIWNLGIGRKLFQIIQALQSQQIKLSLLFSQDRDNFQSKLEQHLYRYYDTEREKLIKQSRNELQIHKTDIIKQTGELSHHQTQFEFIRMFKIIKEQPGYQNLKENYKPTLSKDYPILHYLIYNEEVGQKLKNYQTIFGFLTKLQQLFNGKLKRKQSEKPIRQTIQDLARDKSKDEYFQQLDEFIQSWNSLVKNKFELKLDCHDNNTLGDLPDINRNSPLRMFIFDRNTVSNQHAERLLAFTIIASREYNEICNYLQGLYANAYPELVQNAPIFSNISLNPTALQNPHLMLHFPIKRLVDCVNNLSSTSVQYGISTSHYSLEKIQRLIVREFVGCRYLQTERERYNYISYVGEQIHLITELRNRPEQKSLRQLGRREQVQNYLQRKQKQGGEDYSRAIKEFERSIEKVVIFYTTMKFKGIEKQDISSFIEEHRVKGVSEQLRNEVLAMVPLSCLADLYEFIQYYSLQEISNILDAAYTSQLVKEEVQQVKAIIKQLANQDQMTSIIPNLKEFKWALYHFAGRSLNGQFKETQKISDFLCEVPDYWPKEMSSKKLNEELRRMLGGLTLAKVGGILKELPFKEPKEEEREQPKPKIRQKEEPILLGNKNPKRKDKNIR